MNFLAADVMSARIIDTLMIIVNMHKSTRKTGFERWRYVSGTLLSALIATQISTVLAQQPEPASFDIVLSSGRVMDPESGLDAVRDVGIAGGKIVAISSEKLRGKRTIDAHGLVVGDDGVDDAADLAVPRLGHLAHELLFFGYDDTRFAIARAEGVDVFDAGHDIAMAGEEPSDRYLRNRTRRPQCAMRVVRNIGIYLEWIELDDAHGRGGSLRVICEPNVP